MTNFNTSTSFGRIGAGGFKTWLRRLSRWPQLVCPPDEDPIRAGATAARGTDGGKGGAEADQAWAGSVVQDFELAAWQMTYLCIAPRRV